MRSIDNIIRYLRSMGALLGVALMVVGLSISPPTQAQAADSLYVGDRGDNTVKRFDAATGEFLGAFVKQSLAGLHGPGGLVFDVGGNLIVSDQNAGTSARGDIQQYSATGNLLKRIVSHSDRNAPAVPRGIVLWNDHLLVAEFSTESRQHKPVSPGRLLKYTRAGVLVGAFTPPSLSTGAFHPRGLVVGPDGLLYVSNFPDLVTGLGGHVLRFNPDSGDFVEFIASTGGATCGCINELNRPEGLVFGPDGNLYVTSFRASVNDTDKIVVFQGPNGASPGAYIDRIDLDASFLPRAFAQALLFGPEGKLFVAISGNGPATGSVRRYDVTSKTFDVFVPARAQGGPLRQPWYLSFGKTDPGTLQYAGSPPPPPAAPNLQRCICRDGTLFETCAALDCFSSAEQDAICVPACASRGGLAATGCLFDDPICLAPLAADSWLPRPLTAAPQRSFAAPRIPSLSTPAKDVIIEPKNAAN